MQNDAASENESQERSQARPHWRSAGLPHFTSVLGFIILADFLFYAQPRGCTVAVFCAILLFVLLLFQKPPIWNWPTMTLAVMLLGLIFAMLNYPGVLPVILFAIGLASLALTGREGWYTDAWLWLCRWLVFLKSGWLKWWHDLSLVDTWCKAQFNLGGIGSLLRRWAIPLLLSAIFIGLFAIANPIIEHWLKELDETLVNILTQIFEALEFHRILLWILVGIWGVALLRLETNIHTREETPPVTESSVLDSYTLPGVVVRCLVLFNAVFAVQTILDIRFLWGGAVLPEGMTYGTYAHRGAYPLVVTALLAALFVLITFRRFTNTRAMCAARRLVYVWLAQNVFLVISAAWRLRIYIEVYTLTRMRVAAGIWMFLVVMGLAWICWRILAGRSNNWLIGVNLLTLLFVLYLCSFVNFDGMIASYNVRHCKEITSRGVPIDLEYLRELGPESLPALESLIDKTDDRRVQMNAKLHLDQLTQELARDLRNWRGWCYRRHLLTRRAESSAVYAGGGVRWTAEEKRPAALRTLIDEGYKEYTTNSIGMRMRLIPPGSFLMGPEGRQRKVTLTKPFYIGVYEVTQREYEMLMGTNPSHITGPNRPVEMLSFHDAAVFCEKLSQRENVTYRLPTEAEWEYACRAGTKSMYYWGDIYDKRYCWNGPAIGRGVQKVGGRLPNAWGLYDMSGNVWEWCSDSDGVRPGGDLIDPEGPTYGASRVLRGGSNRDNPHWWRSASVEAQSPDTKWSWIGFRVVLRAPTPE